MVKILFGVAGEGRGHYTRSKVIIDYLSKKHEVMIAGGGKAYKHLKKDHKNLVRISSLHIYYMNNAVSNIGTAFLNISNSLRHISSIAKLKKIFSKFKPDIVISDFEPFTNYVALLHNIPSITIDNEHVITKSEIKFDNRFLADYLKSVSVIKSIILKARYHLVTSFFFPKLKDKKTFLFPPVLRDNVLKARPQNKNHILVYQTSKTFKKLVPTLLKVNEKFIIYGLDREKKYKNLVFKEFNEDDFFKNLANCKAVIQNGGFSLMTEAIHLGKPVLSIPVRKQFEQILNAIYLQRVGYGEFRKNISVKIVNNFISKINVYRKNLKKYEKQNNDLLFRKLDKIIKELT